MPTRTPKFPYKDNPLYVPTVKAYKTMYLHVLRQLESLAGYKNASKMRTLRMAQGAWNTFILQTEGQYSGAYPASVASAAWLGCLHARKEFHNKKEGN